MIVAGEFVYEGIAEVDSYHIFRQFWTCLSSLVKENDTRREDKEKMKGN